MKKLLRPLLFTALLVFLSLPSHAQEGVFTSGNNPQPVHLNIKPQPATTPEQLKCMRRVLLTIGSQPYEVSRIRSLRYTKTSGEYVTEQNQNHPANNCEIVDGGTVRDFSTGFKTWKDIDIEVSDNTPQKPGMFITTYAAQKTVLEDMQKSMMYKKMPDGTRKFVWDKVEIYLLPKEIFKTANGEPVVVYCTANRDDIKNNMCTAKYYHPDGLAFGYSYVEKKDAPSDHFGLDILARKRFKAMKFTGDVAAAAAAPVTVPAPVAPPAQNSAAPAQAQKTP